MAVFFTVLLPISAWLTQPTCAMMGKFAAHRITEAEPRSHWSYTEDQKHLLSAGSFMQRFERSPSAAAVIDFHSKPSQSSTEFIAENSTTFNGTSVTSQQEGHLPTQKLSNQTLRNETEDLEIVSLSTDFHSFAASKESPIQNDTVEGEAGDDYYSDYETETSVYDEVTTLPNYVVSDNGATDTSTSDKVDSSQLEKTHSFTVSNSTRTTGRALSTSNGQDLSWEAMSTKVTSTFVEDFSSREEMNDVKLATGVIVAITLTIFFVLIAAGGSGYFWYRRRFTNRPETLNDRYAASEAGNSGGEDIFRVGYIHHPELPKDSSEEMYSLDNDSFLTSLEAMTIPNYWTENIKHTKL